MGCSDADPNGDPDQGVVEKVAGDKQRTAVGLTVPDSIVVRVLSGSGVPVPDETVTWHVADGGGSASPATSLTDTDGLAGTQWRLGPNPMINRLQARAGTRVPADFQADATPLPGSPKAIELLAGDNQSAATLEPVAADLMVRVVDANGIGNPAVGVLWVARVGGGSFTPTTSVTDNSGRARSRWTLGALAGAQEATASVPGIVPMLFRATARPSGPGIVKLAGDSQATIVGLQLPDELVVRLIDGAGAGVSGAAVSWVVTQGGGSVSASSSVTDAAGLTRTQWRMGTTPATNLLEARSVGRVPATFTALATELPGPAAVVERLSGDGQTGFVLQPTPADLRVRVADAKGIGVPGARVTWAVTIGGGSFNPNSSLTDNSGRAASRWTLGLKAGANEGTAAVSGAGTVTVHATGLPQALRHLRKVGGDGQSGDVSETLPFPLHVRAMDEYGNGIAGLQVIFTASAGSVGESSAETDVNGDAWASLTLPTAAGQVSVTAATGGKSEVFLVPVTNPTAAPFATVSARLHHVCALTRTGAAYCWGDNSDGQGGRGDTQSASSPLPAGGGLVFRSISAGARFTCGVTFTDAGYCWGFNFYGQLGIGTNTTQTIPTLVGGGLAFRTITAGEEHACGVTTDEALYCWGNGVYGQLGDGNRSSSWIPVRVVGSHAFAAVALQRHSSCALASSGEAYCWGGNAQGNLGDGTRVDRNEPVAVTGGHTFGSISSSASRPCGLTTEGAVYCWGGFRDSPVRVLPDWTFVQVSAATQLCGIGFDRVTYCWGTNAEGELGNPGAGIGSNTPVAVAGSFDFTAIHAWSRFSCGVTSSGRIYCWGTNDHGRLGNGGVGVGSFTPVRVRPLP